MTFDQPHEHNFDEGSLGGHHAWVSWNWPQMLRSWNFFSENRFLTLFDLIWPLTPCWSRDISGVAHCYFWPSLVKIGQKTSEIWPIMWMLKERKKERRKKERRKKELESICALRARTFGMGICIFIWGQRSPGFVEYIFLSLMYK